MNNGCEVLSMGMIILRIHNLFISLKMFYIVNTINILIVGGDILDSLFLIRIHIDCRIIHLNCRVSYINYGLIIWRLQGRGLKDWFFLFIIYFIGN